MHFVKRDCSAYQNEKNREIKTQSKDETSLGYQLTTKI